jgi:hypothetical protein
MKPLVKRIEPSQGATMKPSETNPGTIEMTNPARPAAFLAFRSSGCGAKCAISASTPSSTGARRAPASPLPKDRQMIDEYKGMGLVPDVFDMDILEGLGGPSAIGHVRYSTTGSSVVANAQPLVVRHRNRAYAVAHNGNLVNAHHFKAELEDTGSHFSDDHGQRGVSAPFRAQSESGIRRGAQSIGGPAERRLFHGGAHQPGRS